MLIHEPTDDNFAGGLRPAAEAVLIKWREGHGDKAPPVEVCIAALKLAYRHFNCPTRKRLLPAGNAVAWACSELNRFCALWITGRRDPTGTWLRLQSLTGKRCELSGTLDVNHAEPLRLTISQTETEGFVDVLAEGDARRCESLSPQPQAPETLSLSSLVESAMKPGMSGGQSSGPGKESGEPPLKLKVTRRQKDSVP